MPSARSVMASGLAGELARFRRGGKQLRRILKETKHVHESIKKKGCYGKEQLEKFALKPEDESAVWNIIEQPVGFVVLGSCCWARATVVNALMGRSILPIVPFGETDTMWRMVRFSHGKNTAAKTVLPNGFEVLEDLKFNGSQTATIPIEDLKYKSNPESLEDPALTCGALEVSLPHPLLYDNAQVIMAPERNNTTFLQEMKKCLDGITPVLIFAIGNALSQQDIDDLTELRQLPYNIPVFFVTVRHPSQSDLTESGQHAKAASSSSSASSTPNNSCPPSPTTPSAPPRTSSHAPYSRHPLEQLSLLRHCAEVQSVEHAPSSHMYSDTYLKLAELGFLADPGSKPEYKGSLEVSSELVDDFANFTSILLFVSHVLQSRLLLSATLLQDTHARSLQNLILAAFDLSRDLAITPKRIRYARQREEALFRSLLDLAHNKQDEIRNMIVATTRQVRDEVLKKAANFQFQGAVLDEYMKEPLTARTVHLCTCEIRDMVIDMVNGAVAAKLASSIEWLQEKFTGTLERCLLSLEQMYAEADEKNKQTSAALRHILSAAYQVEVSFRNSASIFWFFMQKMQQLAEVLPWKLPSAIDSQWKQEVALRMLLTLNESHLARSICHQLQQKVKSSHERFVASLTQLEERHHDRLEQRESERRNVRCLYAPQVAKLSLESSSLKDMIQYGMPPLGQELGRGHFGVVYSCKSWAGQNNLAVKSVALPTDKHWYSLAMEFFYHKNTPEHPRIVRLCGTVIDYKHDRRPTVLLIMERLHRDLYSALWNGLPWMQRLQVAVDVIQGIRYLHSQGLVHRDIKLHNVLLDKENRAKLSDLGFCKVEVMMSGSVVGTPIHMAPELLTGHYDNSVDIYAFGVLLWYLCSGQPRLPYVYEQCSHKEDLFALIKRGMRPERLPYFDEDCWELMSDCWHGDPSRRPLPGEVERRLEEIKQKFSVHRAFVRSELSCNELTMSHGSDCWSTYHDTSSRSYTVVSGSYAG